MRKLMEPILLQEESNLRGTIAQRDNVKKKKGMPGLARK